MGKKGKIAAAAAGAGAAGTMWYVRTSFRRMFGRVDKPETSVNIWYEDLQNVTRHKVKIMSGSRQLTGYLYGEPSDKGLVVICHGMNSGGEDNLFMATHLLEEGYRVFTFDYTGVYESEGKSTVGFAQAVKDLDAVLDYLEGRLKREQAEETGQAQLKVPVFLYGHSWGGYTAAAVLNHDHDIAGVISISGFRSPMAMIKERTRTLFGPAGILLAPFSRLYQRILFGRSYNLSAISGINRAGIPVLVMHGVEDEVVRYDGASIIAAIDRIKNPNVRYYAEDRPGKSGHVSIFYTRESGDYNQEKKQELKMLEDLYFNHIPVNVREKFTDKLDKDRANEIDPIFLKQITDFLREVSESCRKQ